MTNINIWGVEFGFTNEILMKHLRKIQPLSARFENKEISELDFFVWMALALCESENKAILEEKIDNLGIQEVEKFTKDFEPILKNLESFNKEEKEDKKK